MAEDFTEYANYFHHGLRVELGIRMPNRDIFREWGIVQEYKDDLIEVELSRDYLPANVKFELGSIVDVGVWIKEQVYTCNAIVMEKRSSINFIIKLLSSITLKERREFFRLGATIRLKYSKTHGLTGAEVKAEWEKRAELELLKHQEGVNNYLQSPYIVSKWAHLKPSGKPIEWIESLSMPSTISGGGIRFLMKEELKVEDKLNIELHLPIQQTRLIHAVGEVVHVMEPVRMHNSGEMYYPTGMRFSYLEERDRDLLIRFISAEQMEQLRKLSSSLRYKEETAQVEKSKLSILNLTIRIALVILATGAALYFWIHLSGDKGGKSEIESTYGQELGKYRDKRHINDQKDAR